MKTTPRQKAEAAAEMGRKIAATITDAITAELPHDADLLTVYATRIQLCSQVSNIWHATDLHTSTGEAFDGSGRFWQCGSKLCPYCLQRQSQRSRQKLRLAINDQKLLVGEHWHFLTFTMPKTGLDLLTARGILNLAWSLFRKKKWFESRIIGGCKSEEFTTTKTGIHYHAHLIVRSKFIEYSSLRHFWTESLRVAFSRYGKTLTAATSDGMAIANCRRIGSLDEAINEVAKYLTKSTSWRKIPPAELLDLCRIRRWPRMFEFFGSFRLPLAVASLEVDSESGIKTILDTKHLSDGEPETGWRDQAAIVGVADYLDQLQEKIDTQSRIRMEQLKFHFKAAKFYRIKPDPPINVFAILNNLVEVYRRSGFPAPWTLDVANIGNTKFEPIKFDTIPENTGPKPAHPDCIHLADHLKSLHQITVN